MTLVRFWAPVVLWMAMIFAVSSTVDTDPLPARHLDKVIHLGVYAVLGALLARALAGGSRRVTWSSAAGAVVLATLYGISDEWHQSFVPGRTADAMDVLADAVGGIIGALTLVGLSAVAAVQGSGFKVQGSAVQGSRVQGSTAAPDRRPDPSPRDEP